MSHYIVGNSAGELETLIVPVIVALPRAGFVTTLLGAVGTALVMAEPPPNAPTRNQTTPVSVNGTPVGIGPHVPLNVFWNETFTMSYVPEGAPDVPGQVIMRLPHSLLGAGDGAAVAKHPGMLVGQGVGVNVMPRTNVVPSRLKSIVAETVHVTVTPVVALVSVSDPLAAAEPAARGPLFVSETAACVAPAGSAGTAVAAEAAAGPARAPSAMAAPATIAFFMDPNILHFSFVVPGNSPSGCGTGAPSLEPWDDPASALHRDMRRGAEKDTASVNPLSPRRSAA